MDQPSNLLWTKDFFDTNGREKLDTTTIQHLAEDFADGDRPSEDPRINTAEVILLIPQFLLQLIHVTFFFVVYEICKQQSSIRKASD
jgi:hypothetical protein